MEIGGYGGENVDAARKDLAGMQPILGKVQPDASKSDYTPQCCNQMINTW